MQSQKPRLRRDEPADGSWTCPLNYAAAKSSTAAEKTLLAAEPAPESILHASLLTRLTDTPLILGQSRLQIEQILPLSLLERDPLAVLLLGRVQQMANPDVQILE